MVRSPRSVRPLHLRPLHVRPQHVAGALPGAALAAGSAVAGLVRRDKALHAIGHRGTGRLEVTEPDLGIEALATPGEHPCEVRWSRSMGLPSGWPDIEGLAVRLRGAGPDGDDADLLFASTGTSPWTRYLLTLRAPGRFGPMTTLLPVRAGGRGVLFRVTPAAPPTPSSDGDGDLPPTSYTVEVARGSGPWRQVGRLELTWSRDDVADRFDPVARPLAGVEQFPFVTALREPAYAAARAASRARARRT